LIKSINGDQKSTHCCVINRALFCVNNEGAVTQTVFFMTDHCEYSENSSLKSDTPSATLRVSLSAIKPRLDFLSKKQAQVSH